MAPRANWKGYLQLSLVSCPIALFTDSDTCRRRCCPHMRVRSVLDCCYLRTDSAGASARFLSGSLQPRLFSW